MRIFTQLLLTLGALSLAAASWSKEDHEIFRVRDELSLHEGEDITFYDFLSLSKGPASSLDDINKAFKRASVRLHPDKAKPPKSATSSQAKKFKKEASERFARLGLVANILRGPQRDRYDHFLRNGFPKWRGTGYYYQRYRPGLGSVLVGLWLFAGALHYCVLWVNAKQQRGFMEHYINDARSLAWGSAGVPGLAVALGEEEPTSPTGEEAPAMNRKERRARAKKGDKNIVRPGTPATPTGGSGANTPRENGRRKVTTPNGKSFIVDAVGNVFLVEEDAEGNVNEWLLDLKEIEGPMWRRTILWKLPRVVWDATVGRVMPKKADVQEEEDEDEEKENGVKGRPVKVERAGDGVPRKRMKTRREKK